MMHHYWWKNPPMVFGLHEYCPIYRLDASAVKAIRLILIHDFSFQLILFSLLHWSRSWCRSGHTWRWSFWIMSSPRVSFRNLSPNSVFSTDSVLFCSWTVLGCIDKGLLQPSLLLLLLSKEAGGYRHRESNGFPMHAWRFIFVLTLFESCEPYWRYSTVGIEDSQHRLSKFSSFSRNNEP